MLVKIINDLTDADFSDIETTADQEVVFDLSGIKFLSSRTITRMLLLYQKGKSLFLSHPNEHIRETIRILNLEDILKEQV